MLLSATFPPSKSGGFGGIIVGLGVAALHNRFHRIPLPNALSFFGGSRFVPIISALVYLFVGIAMYFVWPVVQQGNDKTSWLRIIPVGVLYFVLYYVIFTVLIKKWNLKTPGREDEDGETKLYTKADVNARKKQESSTPSMPADFAKKSDSSQDFASALIAQGLGGRDNITGVDCCATRLRVAVKDAAKISEPPLKQSGARAVIKKGTGVQVIYGPQVTVIKADLEEYLAKQ